ncbi:MAG: MipA/OmpV family protein [Pontiellaceae bacterium]|jgi:outer membrane scaffolding protein for murein synthesis (MipA/OmpV family)|nr:MipA/OmpV family protein [Pontiellaceae bacterium]
MKLRFITWMLCSAFFVTVAPADEFEDPKQEELPLWEIGLFTGAARIPDYRGSDEYTTYVFPAPYLIYRGKILKADRDGVKGIFWANDRFETGISLSGNPPPDEDNRARKGMDDLNAIIEFGPQLKYFINERKNPDPLFLTAAIRAAISVDTDNLHTGYQGFCGGLKAVYRNRSWLENQKITLGTAVGIDFVNRDYAGYFYDVSPADATPSRPAYQADGGYAGFSFSVNATKRISERWMVAAYYRWDNLSGAACADSPLVKTENNHIIGCALIWKIHRSEEKVARPTD